METMHFHIAHTKMFLEQLEVFVSHSRAGGSNENYGTHEQLSWDAR